MGKAIAKRTVQEAVARCLLCYAPPCSASCPEGQDPARVLRAFLFENERGAIRRVRERPCPPACRRPCLAACTRAGIDAPVAWPVIARYLHERGEET